MTKFPKGQIPAQLIFGPAIFVPFCNTMNKFPESSMVEAQKLLDNFGPTYDDDGALLMTRVFEVDTTGTLISPVKRTHWCTESLTAKGWDDSKAVAGKAGIHGIYREAIEGLGSYDVYAVAHTSGFGKACLGHRAARVEKMMINEIIISDKIKAVLPLVAKKYPHAICRLESSEKFCLTEDGSIRSKWHDSDLEYEFTLGCDGKFSFSLVARDEYSEFDVAVFSHCSEISDFIRVHWSCRYDHTIDPLLIISYVAELSEKPVKRLPLFANSLGGHIFPGTLPVEDPFNLECLTDSLRYLARILRVQTTKTLTS